MRTWIVALLITALLAGCSESKGPVEPEDDTFEEFEDDVDADTGMIRGVVVDTGIVPVVGITVTLAGQDLSTTTNDKGAFQFTDLEPGTYFLEVGGNGYEATQTSATVIAGELPDVLRIQVKLNPQTLPMAVTYQATGHTGCSFLFGITSLRWACDDVDPPLHARFDTGLTEAPSAIQAEMSWKSTQAAGDQMRMFVRNGNGPDDTINNNYIGLISGVSPLTCQTPLGVSCSDDTGLSNETFTGWIHVDGAAGCLNGCTDTPIGGAGAGVMVDQDYEVFLTVFTNLVPDESWTYIADGDYPVGS